MEQFNTQVFISQMMLHLARARPKKTQEANALLDKAGELVSALGDVRSLSQDELGSVIICYYKSRSYFDSLNKVTALSKYRKDAGLTQRQLADMVGISARQIIAYENTRESCLGNAKPSGVEKLASALGVKASDLVEDGFTVMVGQNKRLEKNKSAA